MKKNNNLLYCLLLRNVFMFTCPFHSQGVNKILFCFFQNLKSHAVTMFEVGKLSDESLDSFLVELEKVIFYMFDQTVFSARDGLKKPAPTTIFSLCKTANWTTSNWSGSVKMFLIHTIFTSNDFQRHTLHIYEYGESNEQSELMNIQH